MNNDIHFFFNKILLTNQKQYLLYLAGLRLMASGPITSWEIDGETVETVLDFILGGLQNHCRW